MTSRLDQRPYGRELAEDFDPRQIERSVHELRRTVGERLAGIGSRVDAHAAPLVELEEHKAVKALLMKVASLRSEAKIASGLKAQVRRRSQQAN